jgi:hypothetical protein
VAAIVAGFYATTRLPLTDSTTISFTAPPFIMILTAINRFGADLFYANINPSWKARRRRSADLLSMRAPSQIWTTPPHHRGVR